jgi:uncharacterized delta-60 repeat protein
MCAGRTGVAAALVALILGAVSGSAQAAVVVSETTWGTVDGEVAHGVTVAADGSAYLTGVTVETPTPRERIFLVRLGVDGSIVWQRTWTDPDQFGSASGNDVAVAPDGSVYVTGRSSGVRGDAVLLKFSGEGTLLWQRRWDSGDFESGEGVAVAADGSVYVVGTTTSLGSHLFVLRFAADGTLLSQRIWGPGAGASDVEIGADGGIYISGGAQSASGASGALALKLDPAGAVVWQTTYFAPDLADAQGGLAVAADGSVAIAGSVRELSGTFDIDALVVTFDPAGNLVWDRSWGGTSGDVGKGTAFLADGRVVLVGDTNSFGFTESDDAFVLLVSPSGRGLDSNTWGGVSLDHADDVVVAPGGTIVMAGATLNGPPYAFERATRRLSRLRGTTETPSQAFSDAAFTVADPAGTEATPEGSTTFSGEDAALVRIAP